MFPARAKSTTAWLLSLAVHGILFALLLLPSVQSPPKETNIDLITLKEIGTSSPISSPAVRKRREPAPPAPEVSRDTVAKTEPALPAETTAAVSPNENALEGDSDLSSTLSGQAPRNSKERYLAGLRDQIARHQIYPQASRSFQEEGTVKIRLTLDRSGSLLKVELIESSGHKRLNDAAIRAAAKSAPYPSFPDDVSFQTWKILVPVRFTLAQR